MSSRDLNFEAMDCMLEAGFDHKYILESLIKAFGADEINDVFAYIYRVHDFTEDNPQAQEIEEKLAKYEDNS